MPRGGTSRESPGLAAPKGHHQGFDITVADQGQERTRLADHVVLVIDETKIVGVDAVDDGEVPARGPEKGPVWLERADGMSRIDNLGTCALIDREEPQHRFHG